MVGLAPESSNKKIDMYNTIGQNSIGTSTNQLTNLNFSGSSLENETILNVAIYAFLNVVLLSNKNLTL